MRTARELASEAQSNHAAAARSLAMARGLTARGLTARGLTNPSWIERLERFAAELEARARRLDEQVASTAAVERG